MESKRISPINEHRKFLQGIIDNFSKAFYHQKKATERKNRRKKAK